MLYECNSKLAQGKALYTVPWSVILAMMSRNHNEVSFFPT